MRITITIITIVDINSEIENKHIFNYKMFASYPNIQNIILT